MKIAATIFALLALASGPVFAQVPGVGGLSLGFGVEGAVPVGDLKNAYDFGIGGMGWVAYQIDPSVQLTGKIGYLNFPENAPVPSQGIIPILAGIRYSLMPALEATSMRSYAGLDAGIYSSSISGGGSDTKFGIAPALGAQFSAGTGMTVDLHVTYSTIFSTPSASWVGLGCGLEFGM